MNQDHEKIVRFDIWCERCKHFQEDEDNDACYECLHEPMNFESTKPVKFDPVK